MNNIFLFILNFIRQIGKLPSFVVKHPNEQITSFFGSDAIASGTYAVMSVCVCLCVVVGGRNTTLGNKICAYFYTLVDILSFCDFGRQFHCCLKFFLPFLNIILLSQRSVFLVHGLKLLIPKFG